MYTFPLFFIGLTFPISLLFHHMNDINFNLFSSSLFIAQKCIFLLSETKKHFYLSPWRCQVFFLPLRQFLLIQLYSSSSSSTPNFLWYLCFFSDMYDALFKNKESSGSTRIFIIIVFFRFSYLDFLFPFPSPNRSVCVIYK